MNKKYLSERNQAIQERLSKFRVYPPIQGYNYAGTLGNARLNLHHTKISDLSVYYMEEEPDDLKKAIAEWEWYDAVFRMRCRELDALHSVYYENEREEIAIESMANPSGVTLTKSQLDELITEIEKRGFKTEIKRLRLKMAVNLTAAHQELDQLIQAIEKTIESSRKKIINDLKFKFKTILEEEMVDLKVDFNWASKMQTNPKRR